MGNPHVRSFNQASGRNKSIKYVAPSKESDLRQVRLRRQICPQICILQHDQWQGARLAYWLGPGAIAIVTANGQDGDRMVSKIGTEPGPTRGIPAILIDRRHLE